MKKTRFRLPTQPRPAPGADDLVWPAQAAGCSAQRTTLSASRPRRDAGASWHGSWTPWFSTLPALLLAVATLAASGARAADLDAGPLLELSSFPRSTLTIHSATGPQGQVFRVWLADTPQRQSQGLMYVRDLPADEGMLFFDRQSRTWAMWMKNTFVSLDMLFIDARGRVVAIRERTVPHSLQTLSHPQPVKAVLELKGGETARRGLRVGDRVEHPLFRGRGAAPAAAP